MKNSKLLPHMDNTTDSHRARMLLSITDHHTQLRERALRDPDSPYDPHSLARHFDLSNKAYSDMKLKNLSVGAAINRHFRDYHPELADRLHKHLGSGMDEGEEFNREITYPKRFRPDSPAALQQAENIQNAMWDVIEEVASRNGGSALMIESSPVGFCFMVEVPVGGKLVTTFPHTDLQPLVSNLRQRFLYEFTDHRIEEVAYRTVGSNPSDTRAQCLLKVLYRKQRPFDNPQQDGQLRTYDNRTGTDDNP